MCGKSTQYKTAMDCMGKPYLEQGQDAREVFRSGLNVRVGRTDK